MSRTKTLTIVVIVSFLAIAIGGAFFIFKAAQTILAQKSDAFGGVPLTGRTERDQILARGRAIDNLIASGDARALFSRCDAAMAQAVPESEQTKLLTQVLSAGPLGTRIGESARVAADGNTVYLAQYARRTSRVDITIAFDHNGQISGMLFRPAALLAADPQAGYHTKAHLRLPFNGTWYIFWGGDTEIENHHVTVPNQRHAYDITIYRNSTTHNWAGTHNEDYWAWGKPILAPANGTVVEAVDGVADNVPGKMNPDQLYGNHIVLKVGEREYVVIAHLQNGSVRVHQGNLVQSGKEIGLCGNSGNASEPHLHIHLQDQPSLVGDAEGLPMEFRDFFADGKQITAGQLHQGQLVTAMASRE